MKKILSIFALAMVFASCGGSSESAAKTADTTAATKIEAAKPADTIPAAKIEPAEKAAHADKAGHAEKK